MDDILKGAIDLHLHSSPDIVARSVDDLDMAAEAVKNGMAGFVLKNHYAPTAGRAAMVRKLYPGLNAVGSITLDSGVGGINPMAVETMARMGGKVVWFPTFDSYQQLDFAMNHTPQFIDMQMKLMRRGMQRPAIYVLDENGKVREEVRQVLEIIADYDLVLATGHISHEESYALFQAAKEQHVRKMILSHVDCLSTRYTAEEQEAYLKLGAIMEHSFLYTAENAVLWEVICDEIRRAGTDRVVYSTDFGQTRQVSPVKGLRQCAEKLLESGFTEDEVRSMIAKTPASLVQ